MVSAMTPNRIFHLFCLFALLTPLAAMARNVDLATVPTSISPPFPVGARCS